MLPQPDRRSANYKTFDDKPLKFLKLTEGRHIIRLVDDLSKAEIKYTHWIRNRSLECTSEDTCPICKNNQEILLSVGGDWKEARKQPGFNQYQTRYYIHVFDRTPVKVSPLSENGYENHQKANGEWPTVCADTGDLLEGVEARPSNTVKILSGGVTLFGDLENVRNATLDLEGNPIPINTYDIVLMVKGTGRERQVTPVPQAGRNDEIEITDDQLFDLDRALITLKPNEIIDFIGGATLKDIFAARRAEKNIAVDDEDIELDHDFHEDKQESIKTKLSEILNQ